MPFFQPVHLIVNSFMQIKENKQAGVTLVELLLVVAAIGLLVYLIANLPASITAINKSRHTSVAREIASKKLDSLREQTYTGLTETTEPVNFNDSSLTDLPSGSATYEILPCPDQICTNEEKIKEIKVSVKWVEQSNQKSVDLTTLIADGGLHP